VRLLDVDAAGLLLADQRGRLQATAASSKNARLLERFELQADTGPCLEAYRTGEPVVNADLQAGQDRWPRLAEAAQVTGFRSTHAPPLRVRTTRIRVLNLLCTRTAALSASDVNIGQALADAASIGILARRNHHRDLLLTNQLLNALTS
jgi:hypothetical protein